MVRSIKPLGESLKEYARGVAGGLLFSLPMLYTMELWWSGFLASPLQLLTYLLVGFLLLFAYNHYVGLHNEPSFIEVVGESIEEMGMGLLLSFSILWICGRITPGMSLQEISGKLIVEAVTVGIGISVGKTQLGSGGDDKKDKGEPHLLKQTGIALCGAVLIASNVAPTEEIVVMALEIENYKLLILFLISFFMGGIILYYSDFEGAKKWVTQPDNRWDVLAGVLIMYGIALSSSAFMLWFFGRYAGLSLHGMIAETVVLGFPAALGASAGRLLIQ